MAAANRQLQRLVLEFTEQLKEVAPLAAELITGFREQAARANYLTSDRIDLQLAAKEVCMFMSAPSETSVAAVKCTGRYLLGLKRLV